MTKGTSIPHHSNLKKKRRRRSYMNTTPKLCIFQTYYAKHIKMQSFTSKSLRALKFTH